MSSQNPRDMREYLRILERKQAELRGLPTLIHETVKVIEEDKQKDKDRRPAPPIELAPQTAIYLDTSYRERVRLVVDFPDVIFNTDGTAATIQQYELWGRDESLSILDETTSSLPAQSLPGLTMPGLVATEVNEAIADEEKPWFQQSANTDSFFRVDGYIPGSVWRFRARALGAKTVQPGEWSEEFVIQMLEDTAPPPQPTAPTVVSARGQLTVTWDGLSVSGAMPTDFKYAILAHGTESSPTFEIARFGRGGGFKVVTDLDYYDPQFFRVRAFDEAGNGGPWSEQATGHTTPLVDKDLIISTIDAAKTHLKNIDAGVSILPNTVITEHLVVTEEMTAAIANFLVVNADQINVNSLAADEIFTGLLDAVLVVSDMFEGKEFEGGVFTTTRGGRFQTNVEEYTGLKIDATGMLGYSREGVETFRYDASNGDVSIGGGKFTGGEFQTSPFAGTGLKISPNGMKGYNALGEMTFQYQSANGNVSIAGGTFTGGKFQTQEEQNRGLKIISSGVIGYAPGGAQTFKYDAATGDVSIGDGVFTGGKYQTHLHSTRGIKLSDAGMVGYSPKNVPTFEYDSATGNVSIGGGTFTGGKFQSSSFDNTGVKLDTSGLKIWNTNGQLTLDATPTRATFTGRVTSGFDAAKVIMADAIYSSRPGVQFITGSGYSREPFIISFDASVSAAQAHLRGSLFASAAQSEGGPQAAEWVIGANGSWSIVGGQGSIATTGAESVQITGPNGGVAFVGPNVYLQAKNGASSVQAGSNGEAQIGGGGKYMRTSPSGLIMLHTPTIWQQINSSGTTIQGGLSVTGSKNFVMEHPTKPGLELLHGSTESPVSGIEYWGEGTVGPTGEGVVELPEYFEALAKPEGRTVFVTGRGEVLDWSEVIDGKVTVYGNPGAQYSWLVKAERFGGDFDVEREAATPPDTSPVMDALALNDPQAP